MKKINDLFEAAEWHPNDTLWISFDGHGGAGKWHSGNNKISIALEHDKGMRIVNENNQRVNIWEDKDDIFRVLPKPSVNSGRSGDQHLEKVLRHQFKSAGFDLKKMKNRLNNKYLNVNNLKVYFEGE